MKFAITTALVMFCLAMGKAQAENGNREVIGTAEGFYNLWSQPSNSLYTDLKEKADKNAENKCGSEALRINEYTEYEEWEQTHSGRIIVTVYATYECQPKLATDPLDCLSECMENESFFTCHSQCPNMW